MKAVLGIFPDGAEYIERLRIKEVLGELQGVGLCAGNILAIVKGKTKDVETFDAELKKLNQFLRKINRQPIILEIDGKEYQ